MSVQYRGIKPERNYRIIDFYNNGVVVSWFAKFRKHKTNKPLIRCIFRSNELLGEIRTTCYGDTFAVDVKCEWGTDSCLTTECKSLREAKSILFEWFKSKGFSVSKSVTDNNWRKNALAFQNEQLNLNPFIFQ